MDHKALTYLWSRIGEVSRELEEHRRELFLEKNFNKRLVEELDRLQTEILNLKTKNW